MPPVLYRVFATALLAAFAWLALARSDRVGVTFDEPAHLAAGRAYWSERDYRLHAENGLLPQRWAALPAELTGVPFAGPAGNNTAWRNGDVWGVARDYLVSPGQEVTRLLIPARAMIVLLALVLLVVIWRWSASLWGEAGGLLSLTLAAFCPHLLAHGALVTSDLAAALGFALALLAWWRLLHRVTLTRAALAGVAAGALALSKFSAALFAPTAFLLLALRLAKSGDLIATWRGRAIRISGARRVGALLGAAMLAGAVAWVCLWAGYGFRYAAAPGDEPAQFAQPWAEVLLERPVNAGSVMADGSRAADITGELRAGVVQHFVGWARAHRLLPEAYLYGLAFTDRFARQRLAYFAGEYRERGWLGFFPAAFALKTTLPALALLVIAGLAWRRQPRAARLAYRLAPLWIFAGVYGVFSVTSSLNVGHRHLLPLYPALYVFAGAAARFSRRKIAWAFVGALVLWHAGEALRVRPHYLTYFNQIGGGPDGGHRFFVDSSLDWGQGLPDLHQWLQEHAGDERIYLSYFGSDDPVARGIKAVRLGDVYFDHAQQRSVLPALEPGIYCIGATMLHRVYTQVRGPWTERYEAEYRRLAEWHARERAAGSGPHHDLAGRPLDEAGWINELVRLEQLRFGRLCHHLERRPPDAIVAHGVFVYRLSADEIDEALFRPIGR